jgi:hypothetical protein
LIGDSGYVPVMATGGTNGKVLTYIDGSIVLAGSLGGNGVYIGASPTTCTVGGLNSGGDIALCTFSDIFERILVPTLCPSLTTPSNGLSISPSSILYEVGSTISITANSTFNRGSISPTYGTSGYRSGAANNYEFDTWGLMSLHPSTLPGYQYSIPDHVVTLGSNVISSKVLYDAGEQPLDSEGNNYSSPLPAGSTRNKTITISGIYPYYYGTFDAGEVPAGVNRPVSNTALISSGNQCVKSSIGTMEIDFNSSTQDYLWFAIPDINSDEKHKWFVNTANCGNIGGGVNAGCNLFPDYDAVTNVSNTLWNGQTYNVYVSNFQSAISEIIELRLS